MLTSFRVIQQAKFSSTNPALRQKFLTLMWKFGYISFKNTISLLGTISRTSKVSNLSWKRTPEKKAALAFALYSFTLSFFINSITSSSSDSSSLSSSQLSSRSSNSFSTAGPFNLAYFTLKNASCGLIPRTFYCTLSNQEHISPLLALRNLTYQRTNLNQSLINTFFLFYRSQRDG